MNKKEKQRKRGRRTTATRDGETKKEVNKKKAMHDRKGGREADKKNFKCKILTKNEQVSE